MHLQLHDPAVQASLIGGFFTLISTVIAAVVAAILGKRFDNQRRLKLKLDRAIRDLAFTLAVEDEHCAMHVQERGESFKNRVRDKVRESGLEWSGDFTPGRARHMIARYAQRGNAE
ncbi:hypothetical protein [Paraburkholderia humisilvae]|uniref:Uncharacterized protein n=1 Tax=Paraburkholderia humisilvae TaxID=627669 RepID=A0A6J5DKC4_9BURK|nr:hypothetical protein [Paraburkholderia humisilvae]CAB3754538.1 hypothetical protein LMG29542_02378 [Paraburkholderia humisilvae]